MYYRSPLSKTILVLILVFTQQCIFPQSLKVKTSFGTNGRTVTNVNIDARTYNNAIAVQADGKYLLGGTGLLRVFPNGTIDSSFGYNGFAKITGYNYVQALVVQNDGKIIAAVNINNEIDCIRFNTGGGIDSSYGNSGIAKITQNGVTLYVRKMVIQLDGKMVIAGNTDSSGRTNFFVARLHTTGLPDNSFNNIGKTIIPVSPGNNGANSVALQSDGKIVLTGTSKPTDTSTSRLVAIRLFPNGSRDQGFNGTGSYEYGSPNLTGGEYGEIIYVLSNDKILITGGTNGKLLIIKLLSTGSIDNSFNGNGMTTAQIGEFNIPAELHIRPDGRILVTGVTAFYTNPNGYDFAAYQFTTAGLPDNSFNGNGKTYIPMPENEHCGGSILLSDGKFILSGSRDALNLIHLVRFTAGGITDITFGNNGVKYLLALGTNDNINRLLIQTDGKIITAGTKTAGEINKSRIAIARYKSNGGMDSSFGTNGIWIHPNTEISQHSAFLQNDGKILVSVVRSILFPNYIISAGLFRLNINGSLDNSFAASSGNLFMADSVESYGSGPNLVVQPDGKILLAGNLQSSPDEELVLIRLNTNGTTDNSFGINGTLVIPPDSTINYLSTLALQSDGKILIAGNKIFEDTLSKYFVLRLLNDGTPDLSFGINGMVTDDFPASVFADPCSIYQLPDSKIVVAGYLINPTNQMPVVMISRLDMNGNLDPGFNGTGLGFYQHPDTTIYDISVSAMAIQYDSSYYLTGYISNADGTQDKYMIRVKYMGTLDSSISSDGSGWYIPSRSGIYGISNDIKMALDSSILIGGSTYDLNQQTDFEMRSFKKISGRLYTFTGNGNWNNPSNWSYGMIPPPVLPSGSTILINPVTAGSCILNIVQHIGNGGSISIKTGAHLIIQGGLMIAN